MLSRRAHTVVPQAHTRFAMRPRWACDRTVKPRRAPPRAPALRRSGWPSPTVSASLSQRDDGVDEDADGDEDDGHADAPSDRGAGSGKLPHGDSFHRLPWRRRPTDSRQRSPGSGTRRFACDARRPGAPCSSWPSGRPRSAAERIVVMDPSRTSGRDEGRLPRAGPAHACGARGWRAAGGAPRSGSVTRHRVSTDRWMRRSTGGQPPRSMRRGAVRP